ncbi:DUF4097 family beta strand repeat protein [bacterium]|nr:DUF4097 family beta strand repeat protein [bacterium]
MSEEKLLILQMLKEGKITVEEAEKLLASIGESRDTSDQAHSGGSDTKDGEKKGGGDPWEELGQVWERFGSEMEQFWSNFGESLQSHIGQKWAKKMENWAEHFGDSLKTMSRDWGDLAGEAARQFFHTVGVDPEIVISVHDDRVKVEDTWHWESESDDLKGLHLKNFRGAVVVQGTDSDRVVLDVHKEVRAANEEKGRELLAAVEVKPEIRAGILHIVPVSAENSPESLLRAVSLQFDLKVPRQLNLNLNQLKGDFSVEHIIGENVLICQRGDIAVRDCQGPFKIHATKGDISLSETEGQLGIQLTKGDISLVNHRGDCTLNMIKGDCDITELIGQFNCRTTLGDVSIRNYQGEASITSVKGDISLESSQTAKLDLVTNRGDQTVSMHPEEGGQYSFTVHNGDLKFSLEGEPSVECDIQVINGDIDSDLVEIPKGRPPYTIKKVIGDGAANMKIALMKGDLSFNTAESTSTRDNDDPESENDEDETETHDQQEDQTDKNDD